MRLLNILFDQLQDLEHLLRREARLKGKSNQTVIDYIQQATKLDMQEGRRQRCG